MVPIRTVCFDLDDTLLRYTQPPGEALTSAFTVAGVEPFCEPSELWGVADDVSGAENDVEFLSQCFELAAKRHGGPTGAAGALGRAYDEVVDHSDVVFRPGAAAALEVARAHGRVGLITNGGRETQETKLAALDIAEAFGTAVYAGESVPAKPAVEPFESALDALDATPGETLYVGNSLRHDVAGAHAAGLQSAWYPTEDDRNDRNDHDPDYTFEHLDELADVLREP